MTEPVTITREVAVKLLKAGAKCCTRPSTRSSVHKMRLKGVPGLK